jgi:hypothetical protein
MNCSLLHHSTTTSLTTLITHRLQNRLLKLILATQSWSMRLWKTVILCGCKFRNLITMWTDPIDVCPTPISFYEITYSTIYHRLNWDIKTRIFLVNLLVYELCKGIHCLALRAIFFSVQHADEKTHYDILCATDHKRTWCACSELVSGRSHVQVCLQYHISLPVKTQKVCKMSLDSEMVMKICPLNSVDVTQNNLGGWSVFCSGHFHS